MKKILSLFIITTLIGCDFLNRPVFIENRPRFRNYLQYVVFYPGYKDTITTYNDGNEYNFSSYRGTNYIKIENEKEDIVFSSSAPFKVIKYYKESLDSLK